MQRRVLTTAYTGFKRSPQRGKTGEQRWKCITEGVGSQGKIPGMEALEGGTHVHMKKWRVTGDTKHSTPGLTYDRRFSPDATEGKLPEIALEATSKFLPYASPPRHKQGHISRDTGRDRAIQAPHPVQPKPPGQQLFCTHSKEVNPVGVKLMELKLLLVKVMLQPAAQAHNDSRYREQHAEVDNLQGRQSNGRHLRTLTTEWHSTQTPLPGEKYLISSSAWH
jgi:hypothetical protein